MTPPFWPDKMAPILGTIEEGSDRRRRTGAGGRAPALLSLVPVFCATSVKRAGVAQRGEISKEMRAEASADAPRGHPLGLSQLFSLALQPASTTVSSWVPSARHRLTSCLL